MNTVEIKEALRNRYSADRIRSYFEAAEKLPAGQGLEVLLSEVLVKNQASFYVYGKIIARRNKKTRGWNMARRGDRYYFWIEHAA